MASLGHPFLLLWSQYCLMASASTPSSIRATHHLTSQKQPSMYYKPSLAPQINHGSFASSPKKIITVSPPSSATNSFVSLSPPQQSIDEKQPEHDNRQPENVPLKAKWSHHNNSTNGQSSITHAGSKYKSEAWYVSLISYTVDGKELQAQASSSSSSSAVLVGFRPLSRATSNSGSIATVSSAKTITPAMVRKNHVSALKGHIGSSSLLK